MKRDQLSELAEMIHESSDGHDMLSIIESWLKSKDDEDYQELLEDYDLV